MATNDPHSKSNTSSPLPNSNGSNSFIFQLKSQWANWVLTISKGLTNSRELQIFIKEAVIFIILVAIDLCILGIINAASVDVILKSPIIAGVNDWIHCGSFVVIAARYFCNCFIEIKKDSNYSGQQGLAKRGQTR